MKHGAGVESHTHLVSLCLRTIFLRFTGLLGADEQEHCRDEHRSKGNSGRHRAASNLHIRRDSCASDTDVVDTVQVQRGSVDRVLAPVLNRRRHVVDPVKIADDTRFNVRTVAGAERRRDRDVVVVHVEPVGNRFADGSFVVFLLVLEGDDAGGKGRDPRARGLRNRLARPVAGLRVALSRAALEHVRPDALGVSIAERGVVCAVLAPHFTAIVDRPLAARRRRQKIDTGDVARRASEFVGAVVVALIQVREPAAVGRRLTQRAAVVELARATLVAHTEARVPAAVGFSRAFRLVGPFRALEIAAVSASALAQELTMRVAFTGVRVILRLEPRRAANKALLRGLSPLAWEFAGSNNVVASEFGRVTCALLRAAGEWSFAAPFARRVADAFVLNRELRARAGALAGDVRVETQLPEAPHAAALTARLRIKKLAALGAARRQ